MNSEQNRIFSANFKCLSTDNLVLKHGRISYFLVIFSKVSIGLNGKSKIVEGGGGTYGQLLSMYNIVQSYNLELKL
jgi:PHP family Zn ribbon phosphoesterase